MSKKRRTREEKMKAENKRITSYTHSHSQIPIYSYPKNFSINMSPQGNPRVTAHSYAYVMQDMRKTTIVVSVLFGLNVLLFVLQFNHILKLPFLGA